ncbi:hypothetical protein GCM10010429_27140 [Micromonospora olivasterospora]|uniref:AMP-binding enzyme n=1 Tax=Micromonospora olivasterospora TaxID=1880 RepID=A0A562IH64_MICOL|nr:AMP-binding enzyme [Micromonospora olivasterospora]
MDRPGHLRREVDDFVRLSRPEAFVYDARAADGLGDQIAAGLPGVPVLCLGPGGAGPDLTAAADAAAGPPGDAPEPESFLQTSGTTGTPKLVHHRQSFYAQILALAADFRAAGFPLLRHLSHSPMWLASGQITTLLNLFTGGVLFLREQWDPAAFIATVDRERLTSTFVTPPTLYEVLDHPDLDGADFSHMFMFNVGAGPAAPARLRQAIARFGPCLRIVYGLSEAVVICAQPGLTEDPEHPERLRSCGRPYGDVSVEIRGEDGSVLPSGVDGEVWVRTKLSFVGYHGQPELTAQSALRMRGGNLTLGKTPGVLRFVWSWPGVDVAGLDPTTVTVSRDPDGRWFVTFAVDVSPAVPERLRAGLGERMRRLSARTRRLAERFGTLHVHLTDHPAVADPSLYSGDGRHGSARSDAIATAETLRRLGAHLAAAG